MWERLLWRTYAWSTPRPAWTISTSQAWGLNAGYPYPLQVIRNSLKFGLQDADVGILSQEVAPGFQFNTSYQTQPKL